MKTTKLMLETSKEMNTQDNRCTEYPLFVVWEKVKDYGDVSWCDQVERKPEIDIDNLCEKCQEKYRIEDLPEYCEDCDEDCFVWFNWEWKPNLKAGFFLTAKACQEHIDQNDYHYSEAKTYAYGCWRNPEMEEIIKFMREISKGKKWKKK